MKTKRKRGCKKPAARKSAALAKNVKAVNQNEEEFSTPINQNNEEGSVSADSNDLEVVAKYDYDPANATSSSSPSSPSSDSDGSFSAEGNSSSDGSQSVDRRSRKLTKGHGNGYHKASALPMKGRKYDVRSSTGLRSSGKKQDEFKMPWQDPRYNKKELKAALEVIKKIMAMDEAQPFNVPVDPVASGKSDYYTVIDTPMDFGTICHNLQSSIKYMNSEDVLNDVQYIWENCCKCNKKGEYIVYLMKIVKKKFMKYWTAAGLSITQSRKINVGTSYKPSTIDYAPRHSGFEPFYQMGHSIEGASQMHQGRLGFNQPYPYLPPFSYSQPPASTAWPQFSHLPPVGYHQHYQSQHPHPSTNQPQFSQLQPCTGFNSAGTDNEFLGYSHLQPPKDKAPKQKKNEPSAKHKKDAAMAPAASKCGGAPSHSHAQHTVSQLQPSQLNAAADGDIAPNHKKHAASTKHKKISSKGPAASIHDGPPGLSQTHSQAVADGGKLHLPPQADYTRSNGSVLLYPVDPMVVPGHSHPQQSPLSHGESSQPQQLHSKASHCQPQSSQLQDNLDIEHSHMSLTDSALRGIRCALQYTAHPTTIKSNKENQDQLASVDLQPEQTPLSPEQPQLLTKKRGRGPTHCHFLNDLAEGERIIVHFNKFGQPIGPESTKLVRFLGFVARNGYKAPLNYVHWRAMPVSYKEEMWEYVQTKFSIGPSGKSWVMKSIAKKWRNWRAGLKATYYDSLNTDEERLKVHVPRIVPDQWPFLISYWSNDDTKKRCATNRANRSKQRALHSSGTKSYARILEEERNKRPDGKEPTRAELYILTHTRKDEQPADEIAAEFISKIREEKARKETTSQCSDESNDTLGRVMGAEKHNRLRTYGIGPTETDVSGPIPSRDDLVRMASEAKKSADEEVHKMVVKMEAMEEKYARMEKHIARMTSNMEKFLEKVGGSSKALGIEQAADSEENGA